MLALTYRYCFLVLIFLTPLSAGAALVNINTAPSSELETLNGIGPAIAKRIIDYRVSSGPFQKIEDIKNVSGIGDATYLKIKDYITVGETTYPDTNSNSTSTSTPNASSSTTTTEKAVIPNTSYTITSPSAHYGATSVSNLREDLKISASAGRERLGSVGSPLEFRAELNTQKTTYSGFKWNFGDGSVGYGEVVTHVYDYPGEYSVVLNFSTTEGKAVARTKVLIVDPSLSITEARRDKISIKNKSSYEINLFGKAIWTPLGVFSFPQDTIIGANQILSLGYKVTGLIPNNINEAHLVNADNIEEEKQKKISYLENELSSLKVELARISQSSLSVTLPQAKSIVSSIGSSKRLETLTSSTSSISQTARARGGWLETLKRFFLRTK